MAATEELRVQIRTVADTTGARQTQQALTGVQRQAAQTSRAVASTTAGAAQSARQLGTGFQGASTGLLAFAGAASLAATASVALTGFLGDSIQATREHERVTRATAAAYGAGAQQFERFATALSASTGFASQSILEAALSARTLSANYGLTIQQTQRLISVSADLARIRGIGVAEAFERVQSAIRGEAEASEYLGLTLNDTFIKNNAMNGSLKSTFDTMKDGEKAQIRYTELLRQTAPFAGLAAAGINTLDGAMGKAEASANRLAIAMGKIVAPPTIGGLQLATQATKDMAIVLEQLQKKPSSTLLEIFDAIKAGTTQPSVARRQVSAADLELAAGLYRPTPGAERPRGEQPSASGAFATERAAAARRDERRMPEQRRELEGLQQIAAAERELLNLREGGRQIQQAQAQLSLQEAQVSLAAVAQRRGIEREIAQIDQQQALRARESAQQQANLARESAQLDRDQAARARELATLEREINDVYGERVRLQQESARIGAELASLPSQFALEDAQLSLQRARLIASDRGRSAGERTAARRTIRAEERAMPGRELAALDASAALRAVERQQRVAGLEGRQAQIPLEERRLDLQEQIRVTQEVVDAIKEQQQAQIDAIKEQAAQADLRDDERRNYLQAQLQSSEDIVTALHDQSAQLNLVAQVNAAAIESQQDRLNTVITEVVTRALQAQGKLPTPVDLTVRVATDNQDPAIVYQELIEANGQAVIPPVVQLSGVRR